MTRRRWVEVTLLIAVVSMMMGCQSDSVDAQAADAPAAVSVADPPGSDAEWSPPTDLEVITDTYYGVYLAGAKAGWQHTTVSNGVWRGEPVVYFVNDVSLKITMMGQTVRQGILQQVIYSAGGAPLRGHYEQSGTLSQVVEAEFSDEAVRWKRKTKAGTTEGEIPIGEGASLVDPDLAMRDVLPEVGDEMAFRAFEPMMMQLITGTYTVVGEERISVHGTEYDCHRIAGTLGVTGSMEIWRDKVTGEPVRVLSPAAQQEMLRETEEMALSGLEEGAEYTPDLAADTRVVVDEPISTPDRRVDLKLRVSGIPSADVLITDERQTWSEVEKQEDGRYTATVMVRVPPVPAAVEGSLPDGPAEYLAATAMIEASDTAIIAKAEEILGDADEPVEIARLLGEGVHRLVRSDASVGSIRSASEVLSDPRGVCRDYAALYAGLARAAGIPTKFAAGIVYWNQPGAPGFYYHAWNEVNLDGEGWIAVDSTRPTVWPVDATHIKFAEGDVSSMTDVIGLIGSLKIEVIE